MDLFQIGCLVLLLVFASGVGWMFGDGHGRLHADDDAPPMPPFANSDGT
jgi:hypothetical protein